MSRMVWDLEQAAEGLLDEVGEGGTNVCVARVARALGLRISDGGPDCHGLLFGNEIILDESLPKPRWNFVVGHELGHWDARRTGRRDTEWAANYFASALLLPRDVADIAIRRSGRDLFMLMATFRHASGEALARRVCALRGARAIVYDWPDGERLDAYAVPSRARATPAEREAALECFEAAAPVETYPGIVAWPLFQEGWRRVIVLSDPESVALANRSRAS